MTALVTDNWDPTAGIGDVTAFTPQYTVAPNGGTHTTVQAAVDAAVAAGGTSRMYIAVAAGTYREMVCVPSAAPPITLYGTNPDPTATVIVNDNYSGKPKANGESANPCNANLTGTTYGTSGSATFAAYGREFQAKNLTFSNDTDESAVGASAGVQAVALMTQGDKLVFDNVRVLGNQDTLYVKSPGTGIVSRAYFKNCYVEGDVDFVFGRGTFVLDGCEIKYLATRVGAGSGNVVAPSTDARQRLRHPRHQQQAHGRSGRRRNDLPRPIVGRGGGGSGRLHGGRGDGHLPQRSSAHPRLGARCAGSTERSLARRSNDEPALQLHGRRPIRPIDSTNTTTRVPGARPPSASA